MEHQVKVTPNKFLKIITIIHTFLVFGVLLFIGTAFYLSKDVMNFSFNTENTFLWMYPIIAIGGVVISEVLFKNMLKEAKHKTRLKDMFAPYQTASLVKYMFIEGPIMLGIVFFLTTNNTVFISIAMLLTGYLILQRPTKERIERDLALKGELKRQFYRSDEVLP